MDNNNLKLWMKNAPKKIIEQINKMSKKELEDSFSKSLEFGTAGLRGIIGVGTNRMNIYSVIKASYGYSKFLLDKFKDNISIIIGTDNREYNSEFCNIAANVFSSFGIKVYKKLIIPTPVISYAIRKMKLNGGINITASHNPKEYNGYKVYDENGVQLLPGDAMKISLFSKEREEYLTFKYSKNDRLINNLNEKIIKKYKKDVMKDYLNKNFSKIDIVFSPQHGTCSEYIPQILKKLGSNIIEVSEQMEHDPLFSNTKSPNPEHKAAYEIGLKYLKNKFDILVITDPDGDRMGVAVNTGNGHRILTGNEVSSIIYDDIAKEKKVSLVYSNVSTDLCEKIAISHKNNVRVVPTGFKWMSKEIEDLKSNNVFAFEESYGGLIDHNISRDKDGIQMAIKIVEIANKLFEKNMTLLDMLHNIYDEYGWYEYDNKSAEYKGSKGVIMINKIMESLKNSIPEINLDIEIKEVINYNIFKTKKYRTNLIKIILKSGSWFAVRPSGTEPTIKIYKTYYSKDKNSLYLEKEKVNKILKKYFKGEEWAY